MKLLKTSFYETDRALGEYLFFHYAQADQMPEPASALNFPLRCVSAFADRIGFAESMRALDLGCGVGRATFELARFCGEVIGIDFSKRFIQCARQLLKTGQLHYHFLDHGELFCEAIAKVSLEIDRQRVSFEEGDALFLRKGLGKFDVILMANLIDRLSDPATCLRSISGRIHSGGFLILTSPYTWLEDHTPKSNWIGGKKVSGQNVSTFDGLRLLLGDEFDLISRTDLPFLIREHSRKFQWNISEGTLWKRK